MLSTFQTSVVPGMLQTAEYARRVFSLLPGTLAESDIPAAVAGRLNRQLALYETDRTFSFLITEAALRWRPGPAGLMAAQLDRIASVSTLDNVSAGVIPLGVPAVAMLTHMFVIYDGWDEQDTLVQVDTIHAQLLIKRPAGPRFQANRSPATAVTPCGGCGGGGLPALQLLPSLTDS
jgi:hypothetical protein